MARFEEPISAHEIGTWTNTLEDCQIEDLDIRWPLKSRNLVQPCLVIVCPTKKGEQTKT